MLKKMLRWKSGHSIDVSYCIIFREIQDMRMNTTAMRFERTHQQITNQTANNQTTSIVVVSMPAVYANIALTTVNLRETEGLEGREG